MPDDSRFDLSQDISKESARLLDQVETAAKEVKRQMAEAAEKERRQAEKAKSRRLSAVLIAIGAMLVFVLAYWVVFARPDSNLVSGSKPRPPAGASVRIVSPSPTTKPSSSPQNVRGASGQPGRDSQVVEHPSDEYEQPSSDPGM